MAETSSATPLDPTTNKAEGTPKQNPSTGMVEGTPKQDPSTGKVEETSSATPLDPTTNKAEGTPKQDPSTGKVEGTPKQDPSTGKVEGTPKQNPSTGMVEETSSATPLDPTTNKAEGETSSKTLDPTTNKAEETPKQDPTTNKAEETPKQDPTTNKAEETRKPNPLDPPAEIPDFQLELVVDIAKNKVVYADVGKDFVDLLYGFLSLPMGTVVRLLEKLKENLTSVGCFDNLYKSVGDMGIDYFSLEECKSLLLFPRYCTENSCRRLHLDDDTKELICYRCPNANNSNTEKPEFKYCNYAFSSFSNNRCNCGTLMVKEVQAPLPLDSPCKIFLSKKNAFHVTDNMEVRESSFDSCMQVLSDLGYNGFDNLENRAVTVNHKDVLLLLHSFFFSETPLTDFFLLKKHWITRSHDDITTLLTPVVPDTTLLTQVVQLGGEDLPDTTLEKAASEKKAEAAMTQVVEHGGEDVDEGQEMFLSLLVLVNKLDKKIIHAQSGHDLVDLLFSFLAIPLESVWKLTKHNIKLGCISKLCSSLNCLRPSTKFTATSVLPLEYHFHKSFLGITPDIDSKDEFGFVKKGETFLISNDLAITALKQSSITETMRKSNVRAADMDVYNINISKTHAIELLRASVMTSTALTTALGSVTKSEALGVMGTKGYFKLTLNVDKAKNKVVFADVGKDFIDLLYGFLALPMGTLVRMLEKETENLTPIGCFNNLYKSVGDMGIDDFQSNGSKQLLLFPRYHRELQCRSLGIDDNTRTLKDAPDAETAGSIFPSPKSAFIITDDMKVEASSILSAWNLSVKLGYGESKKLEKRTVALYHKDVLLLLHSFFFSEKPLTDFFLLKKQWITRSPVVPDTSLPASVVPDTSLPASVVPDTSLPRDPKEMSLSLDVLVKKADGEVVYAESGHEFVDLLVSFLAISVESMWEITKEGIKLGCIHNLCGSLKILRKDSKSYTTLISKLPWQYNFHKSILDITDTDGSKQQWKVNSKVPDVSAATNLALKEKDESIDGFVRKDETYLISDALGITASKQDSVSKIMGKWNLKMGEVEHRVHKIRKAPAIELLSASVMTSTALTTVLRRNPAEEAPNQSN